MSSEPQMRAASGRQATDAGPAATQRPYDPEPARNSAAALGGTWIAAVVMIVSGLWSLFAGIAGVANGNFYVVTHNYTYNISTTGWGVINIAVGSLVFVAGCALFARMTWARVVGVALAAISAVMNFLFLPRYPFWAILIIALDIYIIWALATIRRREA